MAALLVAGCAEGADRAGSPPAEGLLAFASDRDGYGKVYVMAADASGVRRLTRDLAGDDEPAWSPDGKQIAFTSVRDGDSEIYLMAADGSGERRLTRDLARDYLPAWQPVHRP
jgi:TolB protein